ncbi:hypothetical protein N7517_010034 [Penicillium concentricum]|uniref:Uncharacterized protein n=1 Tax=Penicillium concentricum TaxID=293559 RepID=A0A9W9RID8_9EURO|nr:uncharacterized protein N7517_010034 [Penicillium concentricum]KAJ5360843.1 hypothetical protein N7517_010034 [Penicillium concentricum]
MADLQKSIDMVLGTLTILNFTTHPLPACASEISPTQNPVLESRSAPPELHEQAGRELVSVDWGLANSTGSPAGPQFPTGGDVFRSSVPTTCCCRPQSHDSYSECFEYTVYTALMNAHYAPQQFSCPTETIPRLPFLQALLLIRYGENVVSQLRTTEIQDNMSYPIWADFVHFPRLRDALVLDSIEYVKNELNVDYAASNQIGRVRARFS